MAKPAQKARDDGGCLKHWPEVIRCPRVCLRFSGTLAGKRNIMFDTLQVLTVLLVAVAMALALAHALELPGKLRLSKDARQRSGLSRFQSTILVPSHFGIF